MSKKAHGHTAKERSAFLRYARFLVEGRKGEKGGDGGKVGDGKVRKQQKRARRHEKYCA